MICISLRSGRVIFEGAQRIQKLNLAAGVFMTEGNNRDPSEMKITLLLDYSHVSVFNVAHELVPRLVQFST